MKRPELNRLTPVEAARERAAVGVKDIIDMVPLTFGTQTSGSPIRRPRVIE